MGKEIVDALYGPSNPRVALLRYLELYRVGKLEVDEPITMTYSHDQTNQGQQDMLEGRGIKGVVDCG